MLSCIGKKENSEKLHWWKQAHMLIWMEMTGLKSDMRLEKKLYQDHP